MSNLKQIKRALNKSDYKIEAWGFNGEKPVDIEKCCSELFDKQNMQYKLEQVKAEITILERIVWTIDFSDTLKLYWEANDKKIKGAFLLVILMPKNKGSIYNDVAFRHINGLT